MSLGQRRMSMNIKTQDLLCAQLVCPTRSVDWTGITARLLTNSHNYYAVHSRVPSPQRISALQYRHTQSTVFLLRCSQPFPLNVRSISQTGNRGPVVGNGWWYDSLASVALQCLAISSDTCAEALLYTSFRGPYLRPLPRTGPPSVKCACSSKSSS